MDKRVKKQCSQGCIKWVWVTIYPISKKYFWAIFGRFGVLSDDEFFGFQPKSRSNIQNDPTLTPNYSQKKTIKNATVHTFEY